MVSSDVSLVPRNSEFVLKNMRTLNLNSSRKEGREETPPASPDLTRSTFPAHLPTIRVSA